MSPGARDLFDAGRVEAEPSSEVRVRVRSKLVGQLGSAAVLTTVSASAARNAAVAGVGGASAAATLVKMAVLLVVGGALSAGGYAALRREPAGPPPPVERVSAWQSVEPARATPPPAFPLPAQPEQRAPGPAASPAPVLPAALPIRREPVVAERALPARANAPATPPVDGLEAELSLVRAAHDALRAGQPAPRPRANRGASQGVPGRNAGRGARCAAGLRDLRARSARLGGGSADVSLEPRCVALCHPHPRGLPAVSGAPGPRAEGARKIRPRIRTPRGTNGEEGLLV